MADLQLRVLGDLEVIREDVPLALPPSRKTRGLLAYLALQDKSLRREQLCELLWEIPDDPRGSLRWSLSKIRKLVDEENCSRIIADRSSVAFDTSSVDIDALSLHKTAKYVETATVDELVRMAEQHQGAFLEGLDMPDFHDFHTWCIGERARTVRSQAAVLGELGKRLANEPDRALDYAIALVSLTPFDESPRAELIRLLVQLDRQPEAEQQYQIGQEKLAEVGAQETGALGKAMREVKRAPSPPLVRQTSSVKESSLVGREPELRLLGDHINGLAQSNRARVILIRGEPGIGKSALLQAAAAMARKSGAGLFKASAFESEMIRPFGVWNDALRRGLPGNNPASQILVSGDKMSREQVFSTLADVFRVETEKNPVVVICDDIQWADESSFSAVNFLLRNNPQQPLLFVVASRDLELKDNTGGLSALRSLRTDNMLEEIHLETMSSTQIEALIQQHVPGADAATLATESAGNPLLALELARAGLDGTHSLTELVNERMSRMNDNAETALAWAAVLAPQINMRNLDQVSGLSRDAIDDALEEAGQQGILHPGERGFRFSHELIRRSIYELISPSRRRSMHHRIAGLLEVDARVDLDLAADLSHHARLSGDPYLAGKAMVSAGKLCARFYANDDAMALYREGLEYAAQLSAAQQVCLTLELSEIRLSAEAIDDWRALSDEFVQLAEQAMDHDARPHARLGYQMASYLRWLHGEVGGAKRFSLQAERISRGTTDEAQILGTAEAAKCLAMLERDLSRADAMVMEAQALAQRIAYRCPAIPLCQGILRYYEDSFDEAIDHLEDARSMSKSSGDRLTEYMANEYLTIVEMERRDCAAAHDYASNLVEIGERVREGSERSFSLALQAVCQYGLTDDDTDLEPALNELRMADAKQRLAFVLNRAAIQYIEHGQLQRGFDCANEALQMASIMERPSEMLQACLSLESVHRGDATIAPDSYQEKIAQLAAGTVARWVRKRSDELLAEQK